jgi:deoxyribodipyrimidine photolyase
VTACSDLVYAAAGDVLQESGKSYTVYTPYRRKWNALAHAQQQPQPPIPSLRAFAAGPIAAYADARNAPALDGTSRL